MKAIKITCDGTDYVDFKLLVPLQGDLKTLSEENLGKLKKSIIKYGFTAPGFVWQSGKKKYVMDMHQRIKALNSLFEEGYTIPDIPIVYIQAKNKTEAKQKLLHISSQYGEFNRSGLDDFLLSINSDAELLETLRLVDDEVDLGIFDDDNYNEENTPGSLVDKFIVPPFSILDTRQGYWQERKRYWRGLIGDNGESREKKLYKGGGRKGGVTAKLHDFNANNGVSLLDPVLAEIMNNWFCTPGGKTYDPFAGDTVFGYVSNYLGHTFTGIELRKNQADLNNLRLANTKSKYICDDGQNILKHIKKNSQDMLFSCPPYYNLEVYSDLKEDASNQKNYADFMKIISRAFTDSIECLKTDRFAVITIGDIRNKVGFYRRFADDVKDIFKAAGVLLYNELILVEPIGTTALRAGNAMKSRKVAKTHQNILVFFKGDPKKIKDLFPIIEVKIDESTDV